MNKRVPDVRGEVLKKAREARGLSVSDLASKVCFSVKQIEQLENGEKSHFYSLAIKANAAKRVADELGLAHDEVFDFGPDLIQEVKVSESHSVEDAPQDEVKNSVQESTIESEPKPQPGRLERFDEARRPITPKNRSPYYFAAALVVAAFGIVIFNINQSQPMKPVEVAKLPSETIAAEPKKEETPTSPPPMASTPSAMASQAAEGCPPEDSNLKTYRHTTASKPGNMVHVQSRSAQTVCVKDASGKVEKKSLEPGGSHSFYGKAPFVVMTSNLGQTDLFFQGFKVRLDNPNGKSIVLEEVAF